MISYRDATPNDLEFLLKIDKISCERDSIAWIREEREPIVRKFGLGNQSFAIVASDAARDVAGILMQIRNTGDPKTPQIQRTLLSPIIGESTDYLHIFDIWVDEGHRRKYIATELKQRLEVKCETRNVDWIFTCQAHYNLPAIAMNEKLGYQHIGETTMWDDVVRVCFVKHVGVTRTPSPERTP